MILYVSRTFTATASGGILKEVDCDECGGRYYYHLARIATGAASAPYYLGQRAARKRAEKTAEKNLAKRLARDSDVVPCPNCGHIQQHMVDYVRRRLYRPLLWIAWISGGTGLVAVGMLALMEWLDRPNRLKENWPAHILAAGICIAITLALLFLRRLLVNRIDPNDPARELSYLTDGAPPALLPAGPPDADGNTPLQPVPRPQTHSPSQPARWVTYPLLRLALPNVCCECLQPSTTVYRAPIAVSDSDFEVPLCDACARSLRLRWWGYALLIALGSVLISALAAVLPARIDEVGRWMIFIMGSIFIGALALAILTTMLVRPHRVRVVDAERGVVRLRFRNSDYVRLLQGLVDAQDNPAAIPAPHTLEPEAPDA